MGLKLAIGSLEEVQAADKRETIGKQLDMLKGGGVSVPSSIASLA